MASPTAGGVLIWPVRARICGTSTGVVMGSTVLRAPVSCPQIPPPPDLETTPLMFIPRSIRSQRTTTPARHSRGRARLATTVLAAALTLPLAACSDDDFSLPTGEQLKQFVGEAQGRLDNVGADISDLAGKVGELPEAVRGSAQDAVDESKEAAAKAQSALNDAQVSKDGAEEALNTAKENLGSAKDKVKKALDDLNGKSDTASKETRTKLEKLRDELGKLQSEVTPD